MIAIDVENSYQVIDLMSGPQADVSSNDVEHKVMKIYPLHD